MTKQEKKIRNDWFEFRKKHPLSKGESETIFLSKDQITSVLSKIFK